MTLEQTGVVPSQRRGGMFYTGWVLTLLPTLFIVTMTALMLTKHPEQIQAGMSQYGFPPGSGNVILAVEMTCLALYLIPPTAVLGAVLLTGYLGGAVATHVRAGEPPIMPIVFGIIFWLGLFLRDPRVRALIPIRRSAASSEKVLSI